MIGSRMGRAARRRGRHSAALPTRWGRVALALSAALGLIAGAVSATHAAWIVTDANSGNTLSTNTILLQDNQGGQGGSAVSTGTAMFNVTNLEPNSASTTQCLGVNFSGTAGLASLQLSAALGGSGQATLQGELTMVTATYNTTGTVSITGGSNTNSGSCTSYPSSGTNTTIGTQGATLASWTGSTYSITSPVTNTWYKFTVSGLPAADSSCATYCGKTITIALTWTLTTT